MRNTHSTHLAATIAFAFVFTISCGEHGLGELEEIIFGESSSSVNRSSSAASSSSVRSSSGGSSSFGSSNSSSSGRSSSSGEHDWEEPEEIIFDESSTSSGDEHGWEEPEEIIFSESSSSSSLRSSSSGSSSSSVRSSSSGSSSSSSYITLDGCPNVSVGNNTMTCNGQTYRTVNINGQVWMAENLNYSASGTKCGGTDGNLKNENTANCDKYGRLYSWNQAMDVCPSGWHLPSNAEWDKLLRFVDGNTGTDSPYDSPTAGEYLKATSGWNSSGNGTDAFGFCALPGGQGSLSTGYFLSAGGYGSWWSSSEVNGGIAYYRFMRNQDKFTYYGSNLKSYLFSVRCLQNNSTSNH